MVSKSILAEYIMNIANGFLQIPRDVVLLMRTTMSFNQVKVCLLMFDKIRFKPGRWVTANNRIVEVPPGSFISTERKLADEAKVDRRVVRTVIKILEQTHRLTHTTTNHYSHYFFNITGTFEREETVKDPRVDPQIDPNETHGRPTNKRIKRIEGEYTDSTLYSAPHGADDSACLGNPYSLRKNKEQLKREALELLDYYSKAYEAYYNVRPTIFRKGNDLRIAKALLDDRTLEEVKEIIDGYFDLSDAFIIENRHSFPIIQSQINKILVRASGSDPFARPHHTLDQSG